MGVVAVAELQQPFGRASCLRLMPVGAEPMRCTAAGFTTEMHFGFPNQCLNVARTHSEEVRLVDWPQSGIKGLWPRIRGPSQDRPQQIYKMCSRFEHWRQSVGRDGVSAVTHLVTQ